MGTNARSQGDVGRIMVVLLTDGRANISLGRSNDDPDALANKPSKVSKVDKRGTLLGNTHWCVCTCKLTHALTCRMS